jgi:UDP-3-O-[3-hydroxymyristoyl] glucosamine N-acyltransferase
VEIEPVTGDPRFFQRTGPHSLAAVADAAAASAPPRMLMLVGVAPLHTAGPDQVSFLDNRKYAAALDATRAGAVIVHPDMEARVPQGSAAIVSDQPYVAWAKVVTLFHPPRPSVPGIHPTAVVDATASIDAGAEIGPYAIIGAGAEISAGCRIASHAVIGDGVVLGRDCRIGAHASISHALIGHRVYIYTGVRIGQDGFGFAVADTGFLTVPQLGRVVIGDDVEIGANTTIDRGSMQDTVIGAGTRIDNLVMIGHNVSVGRSCVIVSQAGISGSTTVGDQVQIAGQAGLAGHLKIGRGARIGGQAGVMSDVPAGADVIGSPAQPVREFFRHVAMLRKLARGRSADDAVARETIRATKG